MESVTASNWITALAILLAPLLALQVSVLLNQYREKRQRRLSVFKTLMSTRAAQLSSNHVQALNMIDVEFYGEKEVIRAWKAYLDHLGEAQESPELWGSRQLGLFIDLLDEMATSLGYDFDRTTIKNTSYFPEGHGQMEEEQLKIRRGLVELLSGERHIPIAFASDAGEAEQQKWQNLIEDFLAHNRPIAVKIMADGNQVQNDQQV